MANEIYEGFHERRAAALGYVYLSRLNNLIIKETGEDNPNFNYLVDIADSKKQATGHLGTLKKQLITVTQALQARLL